MSRRRKHGRVTRNQWFESGFLQRRVHQTSPATLQTRGVGSPREWVFVHKWLLERKRSYLTEKGLFSRKAVKGDATEPINFIREESHGTRSTPGRRASATPRVRRPTIDLDEIARPEILDAGRIERDHVRERVLCLFVAKKAPVEAVVNRKPILAPVSAAGRDYAAFLNCSNRSASRFRSG